MAAKPIRTVCFVKLRTRRSGPIPKNQTQYISGVQTEENLVNYVFCFCFPGKNRECSPNPGLVHEFFGDSAGSTTLDRPHCKQILRVVEIRERERAPGVCAHKQNPTILWRFFWSLPCLSFPCFFFSKRQGKHQKNKDPCRY